MEQQPDCSCGVFPPTISADPLMALSEFTLTRIWQTVKTNSTVKSFVKQFLFQFSSKRSCRWSEDLFDYSKESSILEAMWIKKKQFYIFQSMKQVHL